VSSADQTRAWETAPAAALCLAAYLVPYLALSGWWRFIPSTAVILAAGWMLVGPRALRFFGLQLTLRDLLVTLVVLGLAMVATHYVLTSYVGSYLDVVRTATLRSHVHQFFQVLNDELLMRAALLTVVLRAWPQPRAVILVVAALFSLAHAAFYGLGGIAIEPSTLLTLFAFGMIGNTLFVRFGHIGYGLALHYAWNFHRFNTRYYLDGRGLWEGQSFNYIEGDRWIAVGALGLMLLVYGLFVRSAPTRSLAPAA